MPAHQEHETSDLKAAQPIPPSLPLSIEERRQVVYSSLLRFRAEHVSLRERALNRAVAGALLGSTEEEPFRIGRIQENLRYRPDAPRVRVETIQGTVRRLIADGLVAPTELRKNPAYYLTQKGNEQVAEVVTSSEELFNEVLKGVLRDTRHLMDPALGAAVFRKFVFQCFARFGQVIAKNVAGQINHDTLLRSTDVDAAFGAATASYSKNLSAEALESLRARCFAFLRSQEPDAERLKFHLTQGYYVAQLLGLENAKFDPLNESAFSGSVFYLDTNVLLVGIVYADENAQLFGEMVTVAKRVGIELRVTRATINEARKIAADRRTLLQGIDEVIPRELSERTDDQFVEGYLDARSRIPDLTPDDFLEPFDRLPEVVEQLGLVMDDRTADEIIAGRDFSRVADIMNDAAEYTRHYGKSDTVLEHDVCHYAVIQDLRGAGTKAWFLTRDKSLEVAASQLAGDEPLFAFQLIGFLHTISPFLTTVSEEQPFADIFSDFLTENLFPVGNLFDAQELAIMAEFHSDVMAASPEKVVQAFDHVKSKTLEGRPYKRSDIPAVSLELKKFFTSSRDARLATVEADRERLAAERELLAEEKEEERRQREAMNAEAARLRGELTDEKKEKETTKTKLAATRRLITEQERSFAAQRQRTRAIVAVIGVLIGVGIWIFNDAILAVLTQKLPALVAREKYAAIALNAIGTLAFSVPAFVYVKHTELRTASKIGIYAVIALLSLAFSHLVGSSTVSLLADYTGFAMFIATMVAAILLVEKTS